MYLFKDKDEVEIPYTCKLCLKEISFKISKAEYQKITKFPLKKELVHGTPEHKLIVYFNQYLEAENFEIKEMLKKEEVHYSEELTRQVLSELDLSGDEVDLYFRSTGREAVSLGEMAILSGKSKEECDKIARKFVQKGLFKEIIGAQVHYTSLPPYAALVSQLHKFHSYISQIKSTIPVQLEKSFKELETKTGKVEKPAVPKELMKELKDSMLTQIKTQKKEFDDTLAVMDQIKGITTEISNIEDYSKSLAMPQMDNLKKQFEDINQKTSSIIKGQIRDLKDEFNNIKSTVSDNLQKLRLGVIQQTVDQVIEKVINSKLKDITDNINVQLSVSQVAFADEVKKMAGGIDTDMINKLKESLQNTMESIDGLTSKADQDKEKIFADLAENFNQAVRMAEDKIEGISGTTFESFGNLKDIFSNQIVATLNNTLNDILQKLELSEKVTNEFWEQAKTGRAITMKDIWFIRSPESAKAHIDEQITKAKMRVLIVAPEITDVNVQAIMDRPSRINFRIATAINFSDPKHAEIVQQLDKMDNVDYRQRSLQNIWGINRDYEEVIVCVLSKTEIKGDLITEIAGIGSIIEEHIKIFVPILEEAWMSSRKEVMHSIQASLGKEEPMEEPEPIKPVVPKPKAVTSPPPEVPSPEESTISKPLTEDVKINLGNQFNLITDGIENMTGLEISTALEKFQSEYINKAGYSSVLKNIHNTSLGLRGKTYVLSQPEKEDLKMKMNFWKSKLNL